MTDRRRNLFVLLLVAAMIAASAVVILSKPTRLGLDLKGGVSLTYQAKPTAQSAVTSDAINRTLDIMRERVDQLGVAEPEIQRSGPDQIDVSLPDVKNADEAAIRSGPPRRCGSTTGRARSSARTASRIPTTPTSPAVRPRAPASARCRCSMRSPAAPSARAPTRARSPRAT